MTRFLLSLMSRFMKQDERRIRDLVWANERVYRCVVILGRGFLAEGNGSV
jgi:hypothetical protein